MKKDKELVRRVKVPVEVAKDESKRLVPTRRAMARESTMEE